MTTTGSPTTSRTPPTRARAALVLAWLLATVLAATVAWWAVTAVGGERDGDGAGLVSGAELDQRLAQQAAGAAPTATETATADATADGATASPRPAAGPTASAAPVTPADPATTPAAPAPDPLPAPAAPASVARTWDVTGGQVAARCTGATIGLLYATPADGWSVEVEQAGPVELEVELTSGEGASRVRAQCVGGAPEIRAAEDSRDDDLDGGGDDDGSGGGGGGPEDDDDGGRADD